MQVDKLEAKLNIEIFGLDDNDVITRKDDRKVEIKLLDCEHFKSLKIKTLLNSKTINCSQCRMVNKYKEKSNIKIDFNKCYIDCLDCGMVYHREAYCLTKDIDKFNCYCKLQRFGEASFYKMWKLVNEADDDKLKLYRSYSKYNTGRNHSSDFYVLHDDKTFIIHLNDSSHRNKINRERDQFKLGLTMKDKHIYNIYVCEKYFNENANETVQAIRKQILEHNADCMWFGAQNLCFIDSGDDFHKYLRDYVIACKPILKNCDMYGNLLKNGDLLEN